MAKYYFDSMTGLIPVRLGETVTQSNCKTKLIWVIITARKHRVYHCGEKIQIHIIHLVKRSDVHIKNGKFVIRETDNQWRNRVMNEASALYKG